MFTGIIEEQGKVISLKPEGANCRITIEAKMARELTPDQSVAHNGVCLTVEQVAGNYYSVVAVDETLRRSNLGGLQPGDVVNLERCLRVGARLDGHFVQGHVDCAGEVVSVETQDGSWLYRFAFPPEHGGLLVEKGSATVNGISLTVFDISGAEFSVAIVPYTYEHTNLRFLKPGAQVNLEFDILGKYIRKMTAAASARAADDA